MMKLVVCAALCLAVSCFPSDNVVFMQEREVYTSEEQARIAAEQELSAMGENLDTPDYLTSQAEEEALSMAIASENDPTHEGMEGMKVNLGEVDVPSVETSVTEEVATEESKVETVPEIEAPVAAPEPVVDTHNAQSKSQESTQDVPMAKHSAKKPSFARKAAPKVVVEEELPEGQLMADDGMWINGGTRPSAPQFPQNGMMGGQMGNMFGMPGMGNNMFAMPSQPQQLFSPDVEANTAVLGNPKHHAASKKHHATAQRSNHVKSPETQKKNNNNMFAMPQMQMPQMPMMGQMGQMPQMQMPQMGQMPQMPQMPQMQMPQMPQMPQMQMPQMPQMQMPQMPQMQMPQMGQMPMMQMPQMPQMQMPQMGQMPMMPQMMFPNFGQPAQPTQ